MRRRNILLKGKDKSKSKPKKSQRSKRAHPSREEGFSVVLLLLCAFEAQYIYVLAEFRASTLHPVVCVRGSVHHLRWPSSVPRRQVLDDLSSDTWRRETAYHGKQ